MSKPTLDQLKMVASIIEYRCDNIRKVKDLLEIDITELYAAKSQRTRDAICADIYNKLEYIETLLSKNIDDIMSMEIMDIDSMERETKPLDINNLLTNDGCSYIQ